MRAATCDVRGVKQVPGWIWSAICVAAVSSAVWTAVGCVASRGTLGPTGYTSNYGYELPYRPGTKTLLPPEWGVDNLRLEQATWVRKDQDRYVTEYRFDNDGDGKTDHSFKTFTYALRYEHRVDAGVVWLREIPIAPKLRNKDLRVLLQTYLDEIAGATYETVNIGTGLPTVVVEHRQAPVILEEGPATVAGQSGYAVTIDLANVDEVRVTPHARVMRIQLVVMHAPKDEVYEPINKRMPREVYPVIMLAGYSNLPTDFAKHLGDFHSLLRNMTVAGKSGLTLTLSPAAAPVAHTPAAAAPVAPTPAAHAPAAPAPAAPTPAPPQ